MWKPTKPALPVTSTVMAPSLEGAHERCTACHLISFAGLKVETGETEPESVLIAPYADEDAPPGAPKTA